MEGPLSRREREVADLVAEGLTNREIAERLVISERTAEGHVEQIRNKLGYRSRSQIAAWVAAQRVGHVAAPVASVAAVAHPRIDPFVLRRPRRAHILVFLAALLVAISALTLWPRSAAATLVVVAGIGSDGFSGDDGPATAAQLSEITSMGFDRDGRLFIADSYQAPFQSFPTSRTRVRRIDTSGTIKGLIGEVSPRKSFNFAELASSLGVLPGGRVAIAPGGELYISWTADTDYRVTTEGINFVGRIESNGAWTWIAGGCGAIPCGGFDVPDRRTHLSGVRGIAVDSRHTVYAAGSDVIVAIPREGPVITVAGTGQRGYGGDGGPAEKAAIYAPASLALSPDGSLHIADTYNQRVRAIDHGGIIRTVAGNGTQGFSGDGGPATQAQLSLPSDLAFGRDGVLYVADTGNARVRAIAKDGTITTVIGPDGLVRPTAVAVHPDGTLYIADSGAHRIFKLVR